MVYIGVSARILLNIEALNMTESVGGFVRHRRAPIVIPTETGYTLKYVPVVSGETLAHAYQEILADLVINNNNSNIKNKVCMLCRQGILLKHTDKGVFDRSGISKPRNSKDPVEVERNIVKECIVEDVGGFLYTDASLKRTSRISFGYMIPALDSIKASAAEAQFHVRYDPDPKYQEKYQAIINIETGSALYTLNASLNLNGIGVSGMELDSDGKPKAIVNKDEIIERGELALKALEIMITQQSFGAKKTRFNSHWEIRSLVIVVSEPIPLNPQPAHSPKYIKETIERVETAVESLNDGDININEKAKIYYYINENIEKPTTSSGKDENIEIAEKSNPIEAFRDARNYATTLLKQYYGVDKGQKS